MAEIRVLIADDHAMLRSGLKLLINTQTDMKVIGEAGDFRTTREKVFELNSHRQGFRLLAATVRFHAGLFGFFSFRSFVV